MTWLVYILRCSDGTYYTGVTTDIARRLNEHNHSPKGAKYTKARRPVTLVFHTHFKNRSEAQKAEYRLKKLSRVQKEQVINEFAKIS